MKLRVNHARSRHASTTLRRLLGVGVTAGLAVGVAVSGGSAGSAATTTVSPNWPAYLKGAVHNSYAPAQKAITTANAAKIVRKWRDFPNTDFNASPTVADDAVFISANTGWFYKLKATTGAVLHKVFIGTQPKKTCGAMGPVSTATVANSPTTHQATVYVTGANGYLYALNASNLAVEWKSVIELPSSTTSNYFDWSSPTVTDDTIYVGVASSCDNPLIRGGVIAYNQSNGTKIAQWYSVPSGDIGGSVWSSVAVGPGGYVYASTGNGPETNSTTQLVGYSDSIVKLTPKTLMPVAYFQIPVSQLGNDADFGASPVIVDGDVGACDKNGWFYMLSQTATTPPVSGSLSPLPTMNVVWEDKIGDAASGGDSCIAAPAVYNDNLYLAAVGGTINGKTYKGTVWRVRAGTGNLEWETGVGGGPLGSVSLDGGGVVTVPIYSSAAKQPSLYLVDGANGHVLKGLTSGAQEFSQAVFADNMMFSATAHGVYGWVKG